MSDQQSTPEIITRQQAIERGLTYYRTGKACKNGHLGKRVTVSGQCYDCLLAVQNTARKKMRAKIRGNKRNRNM